MRPTIFLVSVAVATLLASVAGAQPASSAPPAASASAAAAAAPSLAETLTGQPKADYDSARMLFGVSDFTGAFIKFASAYAATKDPRLLFNMATCESKLHHYAKALDMMRRYATEGAALLSDQDRAEAGAAIQAFQPLTSTVTITASEPGATVSLDEQVVGQTPLLPQVVDIGVHKLRVSKPEFVDFTQDVTVPGAAELAIAANLARVVHEGRLAVHADPGDGIEVDGAPVGNGDWAGVLQSGGHTLRVVAAKMIPYQSEVLIQDGQAREVRVTLNPEPRKGLPLWAWVAGGVVVAGGLGVGGYFLFKPSPSTYTGPPGTLNPPGVVMASAPLHF